MPEEGTKEGWNIRLKNQPPNSPDLNVLDLEYVNSISFYSETLNNTFLTLQKVMECVLMADCGNNAKLPHMHKETLARHRILLKNFPLKMLSNKHQIDLKSFRSLPQSPIDNFFCEIMYSVLFIMLIFFVV